jgi:hypothetical protein
VFHTQPFMSVLIQLVETEMSIDEKTLNSVSITETLVKTELIIKAASNW